MQIIVLNFSQATGLAGGLRMPFKGILMAVCLAAHGADCRKTRFFETCSVCLP